MNFSTRAPSARPIAKTGAGAASAAPVLARKVRRRMIPFPCLMPCQHTTPPRRAPMVSAPPSIAYRPAMLWLIEMTLRVLPGPLRRRIPDGYVRLLAQFAQFGMVGVFGFLVDTAVVYALRAPVGLYAAGAAAYAVAVTATWYLNRIWTFRSIGNIGSGARQWVRYAVATAPGLVLNLGTYSVLVATSALCAAEPVLAVASGAVAGMFANFTLSRALVFR